MTHEPLAAKMSSIATTYSPYPASFDNSGILYAKSLASLMSLAMFGLVLCGWMLREIWRDRGVAYPTNSARLFRTMMAIIGFAISLRSTPEILFMTLYGEVTGDTMAVIMKWKRVADILAFPVVASWMLIFVLIYPQLILGFRTEIAGGIVKTDPLSLWHRLGKPALIFLTIYLISCLMAYAKWALAHHG